MANKARRDPTRTQVLKQLKRFFDSRPNNYPHKRYPLLKDLVEAKLSKRGDSWQAVEKRYGSEVMPSDSNLSRIMEVIGGELRRYYDKEATDEDTILIAFSDVKPSRYAHYQPSFTWRELPDTGSPGAELLSAMPREAEGRTLAPRLKRQAKRQYLDKLLGTLEELARRYSPVRGNRQKGLSVPSAWADQPPLQNLIYRRSRSALDPTKSIPYRDVLEAFEKVKQAVVLGEPGAGKSTLLYRLAYELAKCAQDDPQAPIPLFADLKYWTGDEPLVEFLHRKSKWIGADIFELSRAGRLVVILDALNQMPVDKWSDKRDQILAFKNKLSEDTPIYSSCRLDDYGEALQLGLDTLTLEPLSPPRIKAVLHQWDDNLGLPPEDAERLFWQLAGSRELAAALAAWTASGGDEESFWSKDSRDEVFKRLSWNHRELWLRHIPDRRSLLRLASNPFMFTMFYLVTRPEETVALARDIPRNRGDLFRDFIDTLLEKAGLRGPNEHTGKFAPTQAGERLLTGLRQIAWRMQSDPIKGGKGKSGVLTVISDTEALTLVGVDKGLLKQARDTSLIEGEHALSFCHELLQEHFAAQELNSRLDELSATELWPADRWWERSGWEEVCVLLAGLYQKDCTQVIKWLADTQPEVAAQCILESGAAIQDHDNVLLSLRKKWLPRLTGRKSDPQPEARAAVGRALGKLRLKKNDESLDNREGVGLNSKGLPDIDWVEIPGGEFIYQDGKQPIDTFSIARYPITNIQFQVFCDDPNGYVNDQWWEGMENPDRTRKDGEWSESNSPRENVSWHEATAFCSWLSKQRGDKVRLPTEQEWERAARGRDGRRYPWGDQRNPGHGNFLELDHCLRRTSAVGIYPQGAAKEGPDEEPIYDLAGNVWEWCSNQHHPPHRPNTRGSQPRVMRGGCWIYSLDNACGTTRHINSPPNYRYLYVGFRVASSSPIL